MIEFGLRFQITVAAFPAQTQQSAAKARTAKAGESN